MPNDAMADEGKGGQTEGDVEQSAVTPQIGTPKAFFENNDAASTCGQAGLNRCQLMREMLQRVHYGRPLTVIQYVMRISWSQKKP